MDAGRFLQDSEVPIESYLGHLPAMWRTEKKCFDCHSLGYSDLNETSFSYDYLI